MTEPSHLYPFSQHAHQHQNPTQYHHYCEQQQPQQQQPHPTLLQSTMPVSVTNNGLPHQQPALDMIMRIMQQPNGIHIMEGIANIVQSLNTVNWNASISSSASMSTSTYVHTTHPAHLQSQQQQPPPYTPDQATVPVTAESHSYSNPTMMYHGHQKQHDAHYLHQAQNHKQQHQHQEQQIQTQHSQLQPTAQPHIQSNVDNTDRHSDRDSNSRHSPSRKRTAYVDRKRTRSRSRSRSRSPSSRRSIKRRRSRSPTHRLSHTSITTRGSSPVRSLYVVVHSRDSPPFESSNKRSSRKSSSNDFSANSKTHDVILPKVPKEISKDDIVSCIVNIGISKKSIENITLRPCKSGTTRNVFIHLNDKEAAKHIIRMSQDQKLQLNPSTTTTRTPDYTKTPKNQTGKNNFIFIEARMANQSKTTHNDKERTRERIEVGRSSNIGSRICTYHYQSSGCHFSDCMSDHPSVITQIDKDRMSRVCPFYNTRGCAFGPKCNLEHVCWRRNRDRSWFRENGI